MTVSDEDLDEVERVYTTVDAQLRAYRFEDVNASMQSLDVERLSPVVMLAWLSITDAAFHLLPGRSAYVRRVRARLTELEPERVDDLLSGFQA